MKTLISIDPGFGYRGGTGYTLWHDSRFVKAGLAKSEAEDLTERITAIFAQVSAAVGTAEEVVIEKPRSYKLDKQKGDQNDLIDLAIVVGRMLPLGTKKMTLVEPATWKGQVPKDVIKLLVLGKLDGEEPDELKKCLQGITPGTQHNVYDAVGIGLHHLRRWAR